MCFRGKGGRVQDVRFPGCVKPPGIIVGIQKKVLVKFHFLFLHSVLSRGGGGGGGGGARGRSSRKFHVYIKSQSGVMAQKLKM